MSLLIFIGILVALIWVHELGHFSVAKLFRVRVDEFAIGFPPRLMRVRWGETDYTFNLLLVGGFVRIWGENPGDAPAGTGDPRALTSRARPVQAAVLLAGIAFNIAFAWLALSAGYMAGMPVSAAHDGFGEVADVRTAVAGVYPGSPAQRAGLMPGDTVVGAQTGTSRLSTIDSAGELRDFIAAHADESIVLSVIRAGEEKTFLARAEEGVVEGRKALGVQLEDVGTLTLPPHLALLEGARLTASMTVATAEGLGTFFGQLARGVADFSSVAGPVGIAGAGSQAIDRGFVATALLTALISINLAIINLLPVPGLDGGRLFILLVESIIRRPLPARLTTSLTLGGFALIVVLMVLVTYHDITRLVG